MVPASGLRARAPWADTLLYSWRFVDAVASQELAHHGVVDTGIVLSADQHLELHDATAEGLQLPFAVSALVGVAVAWLSLVVLLVIGCHVGLKGGERRQSLTRAPSWMVSGNWNLDA